MSVAAEMPVSYSNRVDDAVGKVLRKLMDVRRVRVKDLMSATGMPRATVSRHVNGVTVPDVETRAKYAQAMRMSPDELELLIYANGDALLTGGRGSLAATVVSVSVGPDVVERWRQAARAGQTLGEWIGEQLRASGGRDGPQPAREKKPQPKPK